MSCPLCGYEDAHASWLGAVYYRGEAFRYLECEGCGSLYANPMPAEETLSEMYGPGYSEVHDHAAGGEEHGDGWLKSWLSSVPPGTFLDYGCGRGERLVEAAESGWTPIGIELDERIADEVRTKTGLAVLTPGDAEYRAVEADVIHLGDVIEHLTEIREQCTELLEHLKRGGLLLAQGPLEANPNIFTFGIRLARGLRSTRPVAMAPYHVVLATSSGQRALFRNLGLIEVEYSVDEVAWPAPTRLRAEDIARPRRVALFLLRLASRMVTKYASPEWGNRYRYAGRKQEIRLAP